ncbi:hypothetical protein CVT24_002478 [Panaeolus cyanescens]|uniref:Uncharacterized protein n=1 Tax=Panaeolus cyanescens TaxID=181874 RepID=A0A409YTK6_9AGAR|nr:hypothetical protein CVT24_002478 [Panaeolus cyanescens]
MFWSIPVLSLCETYATSMAKVFVFCVNSAWNPIQPLESAVNAFASHVWTPVHAYLFASVSLRVTLCVLSSCFLYIYVLPVLSVSYASCQQLRSLVTFLKKDKHLSLPYTGPPPAVYMSRAPGEHWRYQRRDTNGRFVAVNRNRSATIIPEPPYLSETEDSFDASTLVNLSTPPPDPPDELLPIHSSSTIDSGAHTPASDVEFAPYLDAQPENEHEQQPAVEHCPEQPTPSHTRRHYRPMSSNLLELTQFSGTELDKCQPSMFIKTFGREERKSDKVSSTHATWTAFAEAIKSIDVEYIKDCTRKRREETERLKAEVQAQVSASNHTTAPRQRHPAPTQSIPDIAALQAQLSKLSIASNSTAAATQTIPHSTNFTPRERAPPSDDEIRTVKESIEKYPVQQNTTEGQQIYLQQVRQWIETHGQQGKVSRFTGFPLKPGGAPAGSMECWNCGRTCRE